MKRIQKGILRSLLGLLLLAGCSPKITSNFPNKQTKLSLDDKVALLDVTDTLPSDILKVGDLRFQDSGFSTDCNFNSMMNRARKLARENGANIVKINDKKKPDLWSSCYRLKIDLYKHNGDVTKLKQIKLKLD